MVCFSKEYEIKKNSTGAMTTAKNDVFVFLLGFGGREKRFGGEGVNGQFFGWWGGGGRGRGGTPTGFHIQ